MDRTPDVRSARVDVGRVAAEAVDAVRVVDGERTWDLDVPAGPGAVVEGDRGQLRQHVAANGPESEMRAELVAGCRVLRVTGDGNRPIARLLRQFTHAARDFDESVLLIALRVVAQEMRRLFDRLPFFGMLALHSSPLCALPGPRSRVFYWLLRRVTRTPDPRDHHGHPLSR